MIKELVKRLPVVRDIARVAIGMLVPTRQKGFQSADYWENRYKAGGNSGAGSYNRLAKYKAETLNKFVIENGLESIIEFGSGDGAQLKLAVYPNYVGVDVSRTAIDQTTRDFVADSTKRFCHSDDLPTGEMADLALSLDVIYHLVEDDIFDSYMERLFAASRKFVIIYSSNTERRSEAVHVRHRRFTDWVENKRPDFRLIQVAKNPYSESTRDIDNTSFADFYFFEKVTAAA